MGLRDLPTLADLQATSRAQQKWGLQTRLDTALETQKAIDANWRTVCRLANVREGFCCRVCGIATDPYAVGLREHGHHHHVVYRSRGGQDVIENVCLLCAKCHDEEHVKRTLSIEGNTNEAPWLTLSRKDAEGKWFVERQEIGVRVYERD